MKYSHPQENPSQETGVIDGEVDLEFPLMVKVSQRLASMPLGDPAAALDRELDGVGFDGAFPAGARVAVAVGSRRIDGCAAVVARLVARLNGAGCCPFIVPAMGSHGGATPEGQARVLAGLGVTEASVGAPIRSGVESTLLGRTAGGAEAFVDSIAMEADSIILVNRVAPHTAFSGPVESGLAKMMAAGLGNRRGALSLHRQGFGAGHLIGEIADTVLECAPVSFGIALIEDGTRRLSRVVALPGEKIRSTEPALLEEAVSMYPQIPVSSADLLIVEEMGKDISGTGMDPLVTGRGKDPAGTTGRAFTAERLVVLGLSTGSGGNATGVGHADVTTERLVRSVDRWVTYRNVITSGALFRARIPVMMPTDRDAVAAALESLGSPDGGDVRALRIRNTARLEEFWASVALLGELVHKEGIEVGADALEMAFDEDGRII